MKKLIALTFVGAFMTSNAVVMAATTKKSVKRNTTTTAAPEATAVPTTTPAASDVEQSVSSQQAAVSEAGAPANAAAASKFSAKYLADLSTSRNTREDAEANSINGYSVTQEVTGAYAITDKDKVSLTARLDTSKNEVKQPDGSFTKAEDNTFNRTYLNYTRSSVLNEEQHGIDVTPMIHFRYHSDAATRGGADGLVRPAVSFTKTFGKFSQNVTFLRAFYIRSKESQQTDFYNYVTISPSYQVTDNLSLGFLAEYIKVYQLNGNADEQTDLAVSASYTFSPKVSADFYLDSDYTMVPKDGGALFQKDWEKQINIGTTWTFKIL